MEQFDVVVIGGGISGMAAAIAAKKNGVNKIIILDRERELGGMLNYCIEYGYGEEIFGKKVTIPEYIDLLKEKIEKYNIEYRLNTSVLKIEDNKVITAVNNNGILNIKAKSIILSMGAREKPRATMNIPKTKCVGVYTAGMIERFINLEGFLPGKEVFILGSTNLGLIVARRLILEGAKVKGIIEKESKVIGNKYYLKECVKELNIPLFLNHTIIGIESDDRIRKIKIGKLDENKNVIKGKEFTEECEALVLAVGLEPETQILKDINIKINDNRGIKVNGEMETNIKGVYACGNVTHIHNLPDEIYFEGFKTGENCAKFIGNMQ